jgi:hypothetical protein
VTQKLEDQPNITSHSFRAGYITQLWRNTNDIEVRPPSNRPRQHISIEVMLFNVLLYIECFLF